MDLRFQRLLVVPSSDQESIHASAIWSLDDEGSESLSKVRPRSREMPSSASIWVKPNPLHRIGASVFILTKSEAASSIDRDSSFCGFAPKVCPILFAVIVSVKLSFVIVLSDEKCVAVFRRLTQCHF